jgi:DNA-binding NarL/FixJ family response regulator
MKPITVLLADDHQVVREGLRSLLARDKTIRVVGEAETGRQAVALTSKLRPAVVVMDIAMPQLNGLEATPADTPGPAGHPGADSLGPH